MNRHRELLLDFVSFHRKNPDVWRLFRRKALEVHSGSIRTSPDYIMHAVRQEVRRSINNNYVAYYARAFQLVHPRMADLFESRPRPSASMPATTNRVEPEWMQGKDSDTVIKNAVTGKCIER